MCPGKCCGGCAGCKVLTGIVAFLTTLTTVAAVIGVWRTHITPAGWVFGTAEGSLALLVFIVSLMVWLKLVKKMCPCNKMGAGCPCGGAGCKGECQNGGAKCSMCHHMPCTCK